MIYNNPADYKTEVTLDMFEELVECKNIHGNKRKYKGCKNVTRMKNSFGDRYKNFMRCGYHCDGRTLPGC